MIWDSLGVHEHMHEMGCQVCGMPVLKPGLPWCGDCAEWEDVGGQG